MLYCISGIVGLQLNILLMCIKSVGRIAYYHRGHIALKHGSDWNIPMSEFHLAILNTRGAGNKHRDYLSHVSIRSVDPEKTDFAGAGKGSLGDRL